MLDKNKNYYTKLITVITKEEMNDYWNKRKRFNSVLSILCIPLILFGCIFAMFGYTSFLGIISLNILSIIGIFCVIVSLGNLENDIMLNRKYKERKEGDF